MVAPPIVQYVADELEKTARVDKQARKAREEKALLRVGKNDDGPDGGKEAGKGRRQK